MKRIQNLQHGLLAMGLSSVLTGAAAASVSAAATTQTVSFPASLPTGAATVPADFVGFGFETAFLNQYDNEFSNNLVNSVASRMSAPPIIRIGGTSGDRILFDPSQKANTSCVAGDCPTGSSATYILGPGYFDGFKSFTNARMTVQAPLGTHINKTNILDYVERARSALGADRLAAIAIGNEVNFYEKTAEDYATAVKTVQQDIITALGLTGSAQQIFEVLDLASGGITKPFTLQEAFSSAKIDSNGLVKFAAEHWYQESTATNLQSQLMNHGAITSKFVPYGQAVNYLANNYKGVPYVLSETGSALSGDADIIDYFGACLWSVDFQLYSMSQGVARLDGSQRPAAGHSLWVPISGLTSNPGPSVRAPFYAQPFIADFIGKSSTATSVINKDLGSDYLTAYAAYSGTSLARVALVNLHAWGSSSGTARVSQPFSIAVPSGTTSVQVGILTAADGTDAGGFDVTPGRNITWAGQQWSYVADNGMSHPSTATTQTVQVVNGVATVDVPETQAVIVYFS